VSTLDEVFAIALEPEGGHAAPTEPRMLEEAEDHAEVHAAV
jgi:hypothetical protein